tara:strand:+ start:57 stop:1112 length:1056 start_codon:yes stop_codon:yes gene_type:complete
MTILIHVGTGKTGSTFLQRNIFDNLCEELSILYNPAPVQPILDLLNPRNYKTFLEWNKGIDNGEFEEVKKNLNIFLKNESKDILISHEGFSSLSYHINNRYIFKILYYFFNEDFKIVLFLRPHTEYLISLYKEIFYHGNLINYKQFFYTDKVNEKFAFNACDNDVYPRINLLEIEYNSLINNFRSLKRCKNLYLIEYERFKKNNKLILQRIFYNIYNFKNKDKLELSINKIFSKSKKNDRLSINEFLIEVIIFFNSFIKFEDFLLYDSRRTMRPILETRKNILQKTLTKIPRILRRFFTWNFLRMILTNSSSKLYKYKNLSRKIHKHLKPFKEKFNYDWNKVKEEYNDLFL